MVDHEPLYHPLNRPFSLNGRAFVVSGASSGIGRAMTGFLIHAGAQVIGIARRQPELESLEAEYNGSKPSFFSLCADLGDRSAMTAVASQCMEACGRVDGVINAAGVNLREPAEEVSFDSWDRTLNLNLSVPFFLSREFVPGMKKNGYGRIINIASLQSSRAFPNGLAYGASKGGVCQLTRAMAEAWSRYGITCNAIAPGFFPTDLTAPVFSDPKQAQWVKNRALLRRHGKLEDLYGVTIFFASAASSFITGQTLYVDGGFTAH